MGGKADKGICWWPMWWLAGVTAVAVAAIRIFAAGNFQARTLRTFTVLAIAYLLTILWVLFFSRMRRAVRMGILCGLVAPAVAVCVLFRVEGVTGDFLPVVRWRWAPPQDDSLYGGSASQENRGTPAAVSARDVGQNDYPQFLGPDRDASVDGVKLARDWEAHPPEELWRRPMGDGWSGFAVVGDRAVTQEQRGADEWIAAYDLETGRELWRHVDPGERFENFISGVGPRATPSIAGDKVYTVGGTGILNCLNLDDGALLWSRNVIEENGSQVPDWGLSGSPLVEGELVIVPVGGKAGRSLVAYDRDSGDFRWGGGDYAISYSSPVVTVLHGQRQVLVFHETGLAAHDPASGDTLWNYPWTRGHPHVAVPVIYGGGVLLSSGYGKGSEWISVKRGPDGGFDMSRQWRSVRMKAKFTNIVHYNGNIYGLDDGVFACLDAFTGALRWKSGRYGHGQVILVGDLLIVTAENGSVFLLEAAPGEHRELARLNALTGKSWNPPALAGEYLLLRNHREAVCYRLLGVKSRIQGP